MWRLATLLLLLSGASALTYQVVWARLLSLSLGVSSQAVAVVVAAFFLGIALGSASAPRVLRRFDGFRAYLVVEGAIGVCGIALLHVLPRVGFAAAALPIPDPLGRFLVAFAALLLPTFAMGASFPLLTAAVVRGGSTGEGIGTLYAANTLGAVLGASLGGFWWIPAIGLDGATYVAAGLDFAVVLAGLAALPRLPPAVPAAAPDPAPGPRADGAMRGAALVVLAATGFASIATEVAWTRTLILVTGGTVFGFAAILTIFLAGLALGAAAVRRRLDRITSPASALFVVLVLLGASLAGSRAVLSLLPRLLAGAPGCAAAVDPLRLAAVAVTLLPPTLLFGAAFPLALAIRCPDPAGVRHGLGRAYAVNTVAGVAGSLLAALWWIPAYGTDAVLRGSALLLLALPFAWVPRVASRGVRRTGMAVAVAGAAFVLLGPGLRWEPLVLSVPDPDAAPGEAADVLFLREGRTAVVSVITRDGRYAIVQNNGWKESRLDREHPERGPVAETLLGVVPVVLHGRARSGFVVGYGGGVTARAMLATDLERLRVLELEAAIPAAVVSVLGADPARADARLDLVIGDARLDLATRDERYDVIVSQPSHPWRAGASALFTTEFFRLVRSRLAPGGVCAQWINLFRMDESTFRSLLGTFFDVFPHGFTLSVDETGDFLLFGCREELRVAWPELRDRVARLGAGAPAPPGLDDATDVLARFAWSRGGALRFANGAPRNTDRNLLSEVRLAALRPGPAGTVDPASLLDRRDAFDLAALLPPAECGDALAAIGNRLADRGDVTAARRAADRLRTVDAARAALLEERLAGGLRTPVPGAGGR